MFPKDWTARSLIVAGFVFLVGAAVYIAVGSITGDPFAWFVGLTSLVPAAVMVIDGISRRRKTARSQTGSARS